MGFSYSNKLFGGTGSATPGGADTQVQFNDNGAFGGDSGLTYDAATDTLTAGRYNIGGAVATGITLSAIPNKGFLATAGDVSTYSGFLGDLVYLSNYGGILFSSTASPAGTPDVGLARSAAGVLKVTDGSTGAGKILVADGTAAAPSVAFAAEPELGIYRPGDGVMSFGDNGGSLTVSGVSVIAGKTFYLGPDTGTPNTPLTGPAAATLQLGAANAASPVGQRLRSQGAATGTDIAGGDLTIGPGNMTGTGAITAAGRYGALRLATYVPGTTGTTASTTSADRVVLQSTPVTLTESSATPVMDYAVASGTVAGGTVWYTIRANDATDFQSLRGQVQWSAVNKGGTLTASIGLVGTEVTAVSSGTLTNTATITTGTNSITINLNAVSSLTQTTLYAYVTSQSDGTGAVTTK